MPRRLTVLALSIAVTTFPAIADVGPVPEPPPPPPGPNTAVIRGLSVAQIYTYWQGRRWLVEVSGCVSGAEPCELTGCFVTGVDGHTIEGGDVAGLIAADKAAAPASITLALEKCELRSIELAP